MYAHPMEGYEILPKTRSYRLVDFAWAEAVTLRTFPPQFLQGLGGTKSCANMSVDPSPLAHTTRSEYWGIEAVGRLRGGMSLPAVVSYEAALPLSGIPGPRGVEAIGATRSEKLDPLVLHVRGERGFPHRRLLGRAETARTAGHHPQGTIRRDQQLVRVVHDPSGPVAQVVTVVEARYREETDSEFDTVTI